MPTAVLHPFQLHGLPAEPFAPLFELSDAELAQRQIRRVRATEKPGYPCRVSLEDAEAGEELLLLPHAHQTADTPYQASGPIFVRRGARQARLALNELPDYVRLRLLSVRAYDAAHDIVEAEVCEGRELAALIARFFAEARVQYLHVHNARRGCYSCRVERGERLG